jgi:hypothetical protein
MKLQATINKINDWANKWRITSKEIHAYYIRPTQSNLSDSANGQCCSTPQKDGVKYLGMHLDRRLT